MIFFPSCCVIESREPGGGSSVRILWNDDNDFLGTQLWDGDDGGVVIETVVDRFLVSIDDLEEFRRLSWVFEIFYRIQVCFGYIVGGWSLLQRFVV